MLHRVRTLTLAAVTSLAGMPTSAYANTPETGFSDRPYPIARSAAASADRPFLLVLRDPNSHADGQAGPLTGPWADAVFLEWVNGHATASTPSPADARRIAASFGIDRLPAVVLTRGGQILGATPVGSDPAALVAWLDAVNDGRPAVGAHSTPDRQGIANLQHDIDTIRTTAMFGSGMAGAHRLMNAINSRDGRQLRRDDYAWLLTFNTVSPVTQYVPGSRPVFARFLDQLEAVLDEAPGDADMRRDWLGLCVGLGELDRATAWYDAVRNDPTQEAMLTAVSYPVSVALGMNDRLGDAGRELRDPIGAMICAWRAEQWQLRQLAGQPAQIRAEVELLFANEVAAIHTAMLQAGREADAREIAAAALALKDTPRIRRTLVRSAKDHDLLRPYHAAILKHDPGAPADLHRAVAAVANER